MAKPEFMPKAILRIDSDSGVHLAKPPNIKDGASTHSSGILELRLDR